MVGSQLWAWLGALLLNSKVFTKLMQVFRYKNNLR